MSHPLFDEIVDVETVLWRFDNASSLEDAESYRNYDKIGSVNPVKREAARK